MKTAFEHAYRRRRRARRDARLTFATMNRASFQQSFAKRIKYLAICGWLLTLATTLVYVTYFHDALVVGDWTGVSGFTRIVIPDTFVYGALLDEDLSLLGFAVAGVKNAIGPALIWLLTRSDWHAVAVVNSLLVLITLLYTIKLCEHLRLPPLRVRFIVLALGLMPVMTYYSVGAIKELPTLAAMTAFYYHFVKRQTYRWAVMAFLLFLFRYQTIVVLAAFFVIERYAKNPLRTAVILMIVASMAYPIFSQLNILSSETTAVYREDSGSERGAAIEAVRDSMPIASAAAVAIRVAQSVLEPLATLAGSLSFFEDGDLSILAFTYVVSLLLVLPSWWRTLVQSCRLFFVGRHPRSPDLASLYALIILFVVPVGGFSFVHHRYLFPVTALVMIAGGQHQARRRLRLAALGPGSVPICSAVAAGKRGMSTTVSASPNSAPTQESAAHF